MVDERTEGLMGKFHTLDLQPIGVPAADIVVILRPELIAEVTKRAQQWQLRFRGVGWKILERVASADENICLDAAGEEGFTVAREVANTLEREIRKRAVERAVQMGRQDKYVIPLGPEDLDLKVLDEAIARGRQKYQEELQRRMREERERQENQRAIEWVRANVEGLGGKFECSPSRYYGTVKLGGVEWDVPNNTDELYKLTSKEILQRTWKKVGEKLAEQEEEIKKLRKELEEKERENGRLREIVRRWVSVPDDLKVAKHAEDLELARLALEISGGEEDC